MRFINKDNKSFNIMIPMKNDGKYRWKSRRSPFEYGNGFSTANTPYSECSYVEWQIGYDFEQKKADENITILNSKTFVGANKKIKVPYELSEIIYKMIEVGIMTEEELEKLRKSAECSNQFLDNIYKIKSNVKGKLSFQNIEFTEETVTLPTFAYQEKQGDPVIEISIQKQQYATGVQPMVYLSIPLLCFDNGNLYIGKTFGELNEKEKVGNFTICEKNKNYFINLFKIFSFCTARHKHDVGEILTLIKEYVDDLNNETH